LRRQVFSLRRDAANAKQFQRRLDMLDVVSSRTPEGQPNRCPVCHGQTCIEPSMPPGDAPCPQCGTLLWFFKSAEEGYCCYEASKVESIRKKLAAFLCDRWGLASDSHYNSQAFLKQAFGVDSLELVEFVMAFEEEFDLSQDRDELAEIKTVADAIEFLARRTVK
jgi:acyl carrier protein